MNDSEFNDRAESVMTTIESALERCGADLDYERISDKVLAIELADGSKIIVNRHDVMKEIWVAARSGGFHFRWDGARWLATRSDDELMATLSKLVSVPLAAPVDLR